MTKYKFLIGAIGLKLIYVALYMQSDIQRDLKSHLYFEFIKYNQLLIINFVERKFYKDKP